MASAKNIIEGLQILVKHEPGGYCAAEHDIFYGPCEDEKLPEDDKTKLDELGWFFDEECDCWAVFT